MKYQILLLSFGLVLSLSLARNVHECVLGTRILPLRYIGETQTMEFRLNFRSNCLDFSTLNFFVLPYNQDLKLTETRHPKRVILRLFKKATFIFDFTKPKSIISGGRVSLIYMGVQARFTKSKAMIKTSLSNNVILNTPPQNAFTIREISMLSLRRNPSLCRVAPSKKTMLCEID